MLVLLKLLLCIFRAGGDSSTTYAPSPHYLTSKMRSLYLEGYNYSVFDLTRKDRVQIQVTSYFHGDSLNLELLAPKGKSQCGNWFCEKKKSYSKMGNDWEMGAPS